MNDPLLLKLMRKVRKACEGISRLGGTCVPSAKLVHECLRLHGIDSKPQPVELLIMNRAWIDWRELHPSEERPPQGAHAVCCGNLWNGEPAPDCGGSPNWHGHLVVEVQGRMLVDASFGQYSSPDKGLALPPHLIVMLPSDWGDGDFSVFRIRQEAVVLIRPTSDMSYLGFSVWREPLNGNGPMARAWSELEFMMRNVR